VRLAYNRNEANFELISERGIVERGSFPWEIVDLPEGNYTLITRYHRKERKDNITAVLNTTNQVQIDLLYGALHVESEPKGAQVINRAGSILGETPLLLAEADPGDLELTLRLNGYESANATIHVKVNETNSFRTNLVNTSYATALANARHYMGTKDYTLASDAAGRALQIVPNDEIARAILKEASAWNNLRWAQELGGNKSTLKP
jgi:hypothetical protein